MCGRTSRLKRRSSPDRPHSGAVSNIHKVVGALYSAAERRQSVAPGASPGVGVVLQRSPGGGERIRRLYRPYGAEIVSKENPGLTPGATV